MRLKRLELFGFKSFADRTVLDFQDSLTGIVGPNGCGKSNVVDAVRWVLGEQRPTSMRGGEMSDVIFKGSVSRPGMSVAEITMVLDNASDSLAGRGAEVSITRRVFASGEGEYLIGGDRVRLKDVRDMLYDTGLGSRGYAVLEQGRIDAVLSANPLERRAIFEEAAGISRFRQRRKETETRLKRVGDDMQRLDDVLRELGTRVRSLKIQAGKAERFVAARDEWRLERARLLRHRLFDRARQLAALAEALAALERRAEELRALRTAEESDVAAREREQASLAAEVDRLADEVARLSGEGRACDERHAQLLSRIQAWRASGVEESGRALELAQQLEVREADLERLEGEARERSAALELARERHAARAAALREQRAAHRDARARSERQNEAVLGALHTKTAAQNQLRHLSDTLPALDERCSRLSARVAEARLALEALRGAEARSAARIEETGASLAEVEELQAQLAARIAELERELAAAQAEKARCELERARLASRIDALRDFEREREGLEAGARALLAGIEGGDGPCAPDELAGLLADHLRTSTRFARALDAALGPAALGLVVRDSALAARLVAWLGARKSGQVRLYVPATLAAEPRGATAPILPEIAPGDAAIAPLLEQVAVAEGFEPLARLLLGDVLLVEDLATAMRFVARDPRWRCVTPEGELVDAGGVLGGHREVAQGAVGRRATADELERELEQLGAALRDAEALLADKKSEREAALARRLEVLTELELRRAALAEARSEGQTARARRADLEASFSLLDRENEALARERERHARELELARDALVSSESAFARENTELATAESVRHELERGLEELQREESAAETDAARVQAELEGRSARIDDLRRVCQEARVELERARRLAREHQESAQTATSEAARVRETGDRLLLERGAAEARLEELRRTERAGREAIESYRQRVDRVTRELESVQAELTEQRLEEQRLELSRSELRVRAEEDLGKGEAELLDGFAPEAELESEPALSALELRVSELKKKLDGLGPVNTDAVAELEEAQGRFDFLDTQRKDLDHSRQSLAETLARINEESVRLFLETFEDVRGHFQVLFRQLFGGGRADLELAAGLDPLEAGIEISARPPGREMLPIGLLSGGQRTMTALALLFAVFRARPSPFCVLDEVDAALDDANVGRFLAMLDGFRASTQFIVVTHNKGTMAACEGLYGITMETKGVSSHVAVEFGEVDRFVPEAIGDAAKSSLARAESREQEGELAELAAEPAPAAHSNGDDASEPVRELVPARARPRRQPRTAGPSAEASEVPVLNGGEALPSGEPAPAATS